MSKLRKFVLVSALVLSGLGAARSQTPIPLTDPKDAQREIRELTTCTAYWEIERQCFPMGGLPQQGKEQMQRLFDKLIESGHTFTGWLGDRAQMPENLQQQLAKEAKGRLLSSLGGKCENALDLVAGYRDKCAALITGVTAQIKDETERKQKQALAGAQSVKDVEMDCTGTVENSDENVPIGKEPKATAYVHVFAGMVMATIKSENMPGGMVTGKIIGVKPNYLRYEVIQSTFTIDGSKPTLVGVDRVNAEVSIFLQGEKHFTFWFKCKIREPKF